MDQHLSQTELVRFVHPAERDGVQQAILLRADTVHLHVRVMAGGDRAQARRG